MRPAARKSRTTNAHSRQTSIDPWVSFDRCGQGHEDLSNAAVLDFGIMTVGFSPRGPGGRSVPARTSA